MSTRSAASKRGAERRYRRAAFRNSPTPRQLELLSFLQDFARRTGRDPNLENMRVAMGHAGHGSILNMLDILEDRGWVKRISTRPSIYRSTVLRERPPVHDYSARAVAVS